MPEILISADAEALAVAYLRARLPDFGYPSIGVGTKVRNPRPGRFVQVNRVGGVERDRFTDAPLVVFHCWAETDVDAMDLARVTQALVKAAPDQEVLGGHAIDRYDELGGIQNNPDPDSDQPRYTFSAQLHIRKSVLA